MTIKYGFGTVFTFPNNRELARHWYLDKDGIKRWSDTNEPTPDQLVDTSQAEDK